MHGSGSGERAVALVVVHGIGKAPPLRTLGACAQGIVRAAAASGTPSAPAELRAERLGGRLRPVVRLAWAGRAKLDLVEYHWAEHSVGRLGAIEAFAWLLGVSLAALDFRRQVPFLAGALPGRTLPRVLALQVAQVAVLAAGLAALVVLALGALARADAALLALQRAGRGLPLTTPLQGVSLALLACLALTGLVLVKDLILSAREGAAVRRKHAAQGWSGVYGPRSGGWRGPAVLAVSLLLPLSAGLGAALAPVLARYLEVARGLLLEPGVSLGLVALAGLLLARAYLLSHVADIALYVTSDKVSSRARTRRAILGEAQELVEDLLAGGYDEVHLAGHSLGSVIALDVLDRLARAGGAASDPRLRRLRGLLTFGSPLDKVAYFFRQRSGEGEAIRAQLLAFLHGVRRRPGTRDYGVYQGAPYALPFEDLRWWQVHATGDWLSDGLLHYRVDERVSLRAGNPLTAHNAYWSSDRFFRTVLEWLRLP